MTPQDMIKRLIEETDMTGADVGRACNIPQPTIHRIHTGSVKDPRWSHGSAIKELYEKHFPSNAEPVADVA